MLQCTYDVLRYTEMYVRCTEIYLFATETHAITYNILQTCKEDRNTIICSQNNNKKKVNQINVTFVHQ